MRLDWDQAVAIGTLIGCAVLALGVLLALLRLVRSVGRWVFGGSRPPAVPLPAAGPAAPFDPAVTAADLVAIRSNLGAVSRQIEDLERRLRLGAAVPPAARPGVPAVGASVPVNHASAAR
jgi:hypothetical protein